MSSRNCPLCNKTITDFLKHLRFTHDITEPEELEHEIKKISDRENKKREFANYVEMQQRRKKNEEISTEEYRELITQWIDQHRS